MGNTLPLNSREYRELVLEKVLNYYYSLEELEVFNKVNLNILPKYTPINYKIELEKGYKLNELGINPLYRITLLELEEYRKYITENLQKGFIKANLILQAILILFVRKANKGLQFCIDYRKLNVILKKDRYPLLLIEETLIRINNLKIFIKIDIRQAFYQIRISKGQEDLTTFKIGFGVYKYKVLLFKLYGGLFSFQRVINDILIGY